MPPQQRRIADAELALLDALWQHGPQTIRQITDHVYPGGSTSEYATVQKLLCRLEEKQCVSRDRSTAAHVFEASYRARSVDR